MQSVWSEEDRCVASLSEDMDNLISAHHPLDHVLEKTAMCLGKKSEGVGNGGHAGRGKGKEDGNEEEDDEGEEESDMEEDDDDDDCYYGEDIDAAAVDDQPSHTRYCE